MLQSLGKISRLKGFFRTGINYSCYEEMLSLAEKKTSGCLPKDILSRLISSGGDKKAAIQCTEKMFGETVNILGEINKLELQAINRMPQNNMGFIQRMAHYFSKGDIKGLFRLDSIYKEKELETIIKAEDKMLAGMKKYIPEVKNVTITPLGCGQFGNGYKLQVWGEDGKKIFDDKVLKVYRDKYLRGSFQERSKRYVDCLSDEKLIEQFNKEREMLKKHGINIPDKSAAEIREKFKKDVELLEAAEKEMKYYHGAMAEANTSEFLRFFSGHKVKPEEGIAIPSYFGLGETKFSLGEFIGKEKKAERKFPFDRLLVQHEDFVSNPGNGVNGICIDMGGIVPLSGLNQSKEIFSSKENMRIFKSLLSCPKEKREIALEEYKKAGSLSVEVLTQFEQILKAM